MCIYFIRVRWYVCACVQKCSTCVGCVVQRHVGDAVWHVPCMCVCIVQYVYVCVQGAWCRGMWVMLCGMSFVCMCVYRAVCVYMSKVCGTSTWTMLRDMSLACLCVCAYRAVCVYMYKVCGTSTWMMLRGMSLACLCVCVRIVQFVYICVWYEQVDDAAWHVTVMLQPKGLTCVFVLTPIARARLYVHWCCCEHPCFCVCAYTHVTHACLNSLTTALDPQVHTHTHTHIYVHTQCTCTHTYTYTMYTHMYTHMYMYTHIYVPTQAYTCTLLYAHTCTHTQSGGHIHTL
jgi:hypothetical protein